MTMNPGGGAGSVLDAPPRTATMLVPARLAW